MADYFPSLIPPSHNLLQLKEFSLCQCKWDFIKLITFMCPLASIQLPTYSILAHFPLIGWLEVVLPCQMLTCRPNICTSKDNYLALVQPIYTIKEEGEVHLPPSNRCLFIPGRLAFAMEMRSLLRIFLVHNIQAGIFL